MQQCRILFVGLMMLATLGVVETVLGQPPRRGQRRPGVRPGVRSGTSEGEEKKPAPPALPNDKRLLSLHRQFLTEAEKLALEYERDQEWDRAKSVYGEILKLLPQHVGAQNKMKLLRAREANANAVLFKVQGDKEWQDTLIDVIPGRPIKIRSSGSWTFNLSIKVGPDGIQIPKELKEYNMGCLIGTIRTPGEERLDVFVVGKEKQFIAQKPGRLFLRMYDISPQNNEGFMDVEVRGTFRSLRKD